MKTIVLNPLPEALALASAGIVSGGLQRELCRLAGVPVAAAHPLIRAVVLIDDIEAMTWWGRRRAQAPGSRGSAAPSSSMPDAIEVLLQPCAESIGNGGRVVLDLLPCLLPRRFRLGHGRRRSLPSRRNAPAAPRPWRNHLRQDSRLPPAQQHVEPRGESGPSPIALQKQLESMLEHSRPTNGGWPRGVQTTVRRDTPSPSPCPPLPAPRHRRARANRTTCGCA